MLNPQQTMKNQTTVEALLTSVCFLFWVSFEKHFCCFVQFGDSEGSVYKVPFPGSLAPDFYFHVLASCGPAGVERDLLPLSLVFIMTR